MKKIGILGGGQLGRMLLQAAANYPIETFVLENDEACPAAALTMNFVKGDISNFNDVFNFGKNLDAVCIEIESVNVDALEALEKEGVRTYPNAHALRIINDKRAQKTFYKENEIPTSEFFLTEQRSDLTKHINFLPAAHKVGMGGYDGKGVTILRTEDDLKKGFDSPSVLEKLIDIKKEVAIIIAINEEGETAIYPAVYIVFDQDLNLLSHQLSPAMLPETVFWKIEAIALMVVKHLKSPGIFAIEFFVDQNDNVWVNETAPRVHNSGHHGIEACYSSQFDMVIRLLMQYPLGNTEQILPAAIVNVLGADGHTGKANYEGLDEILKMDNVFVHLYGKAVTKPGRKMGHITILSQEKQELIHKINQIKSLIKVTSNTEN